MNFGEKIYRLRKEKGLSQEALAELVGTTRQAISKWENNQGYPETEKLLLLSNVFEVSVDFLLKEEKTDSGADKKGYYVSREMAMGYIANEKKDLSVLRRRICPACFGGSTLRCVSDGHCLEAAGYVHLHTFRNHRHRCVHVYSERRI